MVLEVQKMSLVPAHSMFLLLMLAHSNLMASDRWIDPEDWDARSWAAGSSIIFDSHSDKLLKGTFPKTKEPFRAESLMMVAGAIYSQSLARAVDAMNSRMGTASSQQHQSVDLGDAWESRLRHDQYSRMALEDRAAWQTALTREGVRTSGLNAALITSREFNLLPSREGYSVVKTLLFDGGTCSALHAHCWSCTEQIGQSNGDLGRYMTHSHSAMKCAQLTL